MSEVAEVKLDPLKPKDLEFGVHAYQAYSCRVAEGITREDLLKREFWSFVVPRLKLGAEIRVLPVDISYHAVLLVTYTDGKNIRLKELSYVPLDDVTPDVKTNQGKDYKLVMRGQQKWCVQRLEDAEFIKEMIPTKQEAVVWLDKYILALDGDADAEAFLTKLEY